MSNKVEKPTQKSTQKRKEIHSSSTFTCEICIEPASSSGHKFHRGFNYYHKICATCIARHIKAKVDQNIGTINCPGSGCNKTLDPVECQPVISPELFIKWCDCLCKSAVSGLKSCYCPNRLCSELILNECNDTVKKCKCPRCKRHFCYKCRAPWHPLFRCSEERQRRELNDRKFWSLMEKKKWSRCPGCGQPIERRGGCVNVKCRCGTWFCHNCRQTPHNFGQRCDYENKRRCGPFSLFWRWLYK